MSQPVDTYHLKDGSWTRSGRVKPPSNTTTTPHYAFDVPTNLPRGMGSKQAWPHLFIPYPISLFNAATTAQEYDVLYWQPPGAVEGAGQSWAKDHAVYGGLVRTWHLRRPQRTGTEAEWRRADYKVQIQQAVDALIDGFQVELQESLDRQTGRWARNFVEAMSEMRIAGTLPSWFKWIPTPDAILQYCNRGVASPGVAEAQACADDTSTLIKIDTNTVEKTSDGKYLVMPFAPELLSSSSAKPYWDAFISRMASNGTPCVLIPAYVRSWTETLQAPTFNPIVHMHGRWGDRDPVAASSTGVNNRGAVNYSRTTFNKEWMHVASPQDERPRSQDATWNEARGFDTFIELWKAAIETDAAKVLIPTWDDFAEGSQICPTPAAGYAWLDINAYFLIRFKTGTWPTIVRDGIYLAHRNQPVSGFTVTSTKQTLFMKPVGSTPADNQIHALCFVTAPCELRWFRDTGTGYTAYHTPTTISVSNTYQVVKAPVATGKFKAELWRNGQKVAEVWSRDDMAISNSPLVENKEYNVRSGLRQKLGQLS